jgi:hypothetical protein
VEDTKILDLMATPGEFRGVSWLQESLQSAIELEFATLPIYLTGMWSITEQSGVVYELIRSVVLEEMLHMGFACNMLKGIGGTPKIVAPRYSGRLPGGVLPDLDVYLGGLSPQTLEMYMSIEEPEHQLPLAESQYATIGQFYDAISEVFQTLSPPISTDGQLTATLVVPNPEGSGPAISEQLTQLASIDDVLEAIATIKEQGEGTANSPDSPEFGGELAHYYRFGEIRHGRKFIQVDGHWRYAGGPVPFPDCHPVSRVPQGGYPDLPASKKFNNAYFQLVTKIQNAWTGGDQAALGAAIRIMFQLHSLAAPIISTPLPDGSGNYGPDFIPLSSDTTGTDPHAPASPVSFKSDILPLFTSTDIAHMASWGVLLNSYLYMKIPNNAAAVYHRLSIGSMPPREAGGPWSADKVSLFKAWIDGGYTA